jgi:hypothetical protein
MESVACSDSLKPLRSTEEGQEVKGQGESRSQAPHRPSEPPSPLGERGQGERGVGRNANLFLPPPLRFAERGPGGEVLRRAKHLTTRSRR